MSGLREGVSLDTNGMVVITEGDVLRGWLHCRVFRDMFPEHWEELLARPRVQSEYPELEVGESGAKRWGIKTEEK